MAQGCRRAHGRDQVDVPHRAAGRRPRRRHLAGRLLALLGQYQRLGHAERGRRAGRGIPADRNAHQRLLRRPPSGRQPLRREHRRARHRDRRAHLAFPGGPSRGVGLRLPGRAQLARRHGRRPAHQGHRTGEQARIHLRPGPVDRRAHLADRRACGSYRHRSRGRRALADAAVPDQATSVRLPGAEHRRFGRLYA